MRHLATAFEARAASSYVLPTDIASFLAAAGEVDKALQCLETAYELRDPNLGYLGLPTYDPLRSDPRFQDLLRRMNLPTNVAGSDPDKGK